MTLDLVEGRNEFLVEAEDEVGNSNSTVVTVLRERDAAVEGGSWAWAIFAAVGLVAVAVLVLAALRRRTGPPPDGDGTGVVRPPSTGQPPSPPPESVGGNGTTSEWEEL